MNLFVNGGGQLRILCTPGVSYWAIGELIINLGDCLGTIPLHERLTSTTLPWNCIDSIILLEPMNVR